MARHKNARRLLDAMDVVTIALSRKDIVFEEVDYASDLAKHCLRAAQDRMKKFADRRRSDAPEFKNGDEVLISMKHFKLQAGLSAKLAPRFLGPFKVLENIGPKNLAYKLQLPPAMKKVHPVFPVSSLVRYHRSGNYQPPLPLRIIDNEVQYEVDWISATRYDGKRRQYKVHWVGDTNFTWEKEEQLGHCPQAIQAFWEFKGAPCPHPIRGLDPETR